MAVPNFSDSYFTDLSFSWTDMDGCILPVRHQEDTYSCYAFCLVDILYSAQYIESEEEEPIYKGSEQELIDCVHLLKPKKVKVNHEGVCNTLEDAIMFIMRYGLSLEENCPFLGICRQLPNLDAARQPPRRRIFLNDINNLRYHDLEGHQSTPDIIGYARRIEAQPVVLAVIAYPSCMMWGVGREVYAGPTQEERDAVAQDALEGKDPRYGYHLLLAVGYGRRNDNIHYLAKNSYGDEWGFHGFIKLEANIRPPFYDQMVEMPSNAEEIKTVFTKVAPFP